LISKIQKNFGEGAQPRPRPHLQWGGDSPPHPTPPWRSTSAPLAPQSSRLCSDKYYLFYVLGFRPGRGRVWLVSYVCNDVGISYRYAVIEVRPKDEDHVAVLQQLMVSDDQVSHVNTTTLFYRTTLCIAPTICRRKISVRPSVCPSVTRINTSSNCFSGLDSHTILVFFRTKRYGNFPRGGPWRVRRMPMGYEKNRCFQLVSNNVLIKVTLSRQRHCRASILLHRVLSTLRPSGVINTARPDRGKSVTIIAGSSKQRSLLMARSGRRL